ncbi:MAG: hypothetical protein ACI90V_004422 [Bacillariaceae sp.]|jgi:hypothetical protein
MGASTVLILHYCVLVGVRDFEILLWAIAVSALKFNTHTHTHTTHTMTVIFRLKTRQTCTLAMGGTFLKKLSKDLRTKITIIRINIQLEYLII